MTPRSCLLFALLWTATASAGARDASLPAQIHVGGGEALRLAAQARRTHLLGTLELCQVALYADGPVDRARLASPGVAKALRIEVMHEEDVRRRIALDWRGELVPSVEPQVEAHLRNSFAPVRRGDVVQIEYVPARGTSVRVNRGVSVSGAPHDLMLAFLEHWLGDRPVSEAVKQALLAASAAELEHPQRGTGRSYRRDLPPASMTIEPFLRDLDELVGRVRGRFGQPQVVLLGHS